MAQDTNFRLTSSDLDFLSDPTPFLRKRDLTDQLEIQLSKLAGKVKAYINGYDGHLPAYWSPVKAGKVTKGENLAGLPYLVLDQPSYYSKQDILAIRTLLWWGNGLYISLQISGNILKPLTAEPFSKIMDHWEMIHGDDPWSYQSEKIVKLKENYTSTADLNAHLGKTGFLKLIIRKPFAELEGCYDEITNLVDWYLEYSR